MKWKYSIFLLDDNFNMHFFEVEKNKRRARKTARNIVTANYAIRAYVYSFEILPETMLYMVGNVDGKIQAERYAKL